VGATDPMGLQHALEDIDHPAGGADDAPDGTESSAVAAEEHRASGTVPGQVLSKVLCVVGRVAGMRWTLWKVLAVGVLAYVIAFGVSYYIVLKPAWAKLNEVTARNALIHDFMLFRESNTAVAQFRNALMEGDQRVTVVAELEQMAREVGLTPIGEAKLPPSKDVSDAIKEYPMELKFSGSYHEVGEYLSRLEAAPRFLAVKEVEIVSRDDDRSDSEVTITVSAISWEE
jgi:Tfp pilus assembly protein PilO